MPAALNSRVPIAILGVPFDNVTTEETLAVIGQMIASREPHYGATANVDFIVQALEDVELRRILFDAHLVLADGMPIVWASKFLGNPLPERVTGSGMIPRLLARAEQKSWRVFFLGGTEQSVRLAAEKTLAKHPKLQIVGAYSPPFKPLLEMDPDIVRRVREARADILLVAFGCPKQEKWIYMNYRAMGVPFAVGVGATIDFLAGTFKRAPVWMQKTGTEWIFRMFQEPKRLMRRYAKDLRVFIIAIVAQWWRLRVRRSMASAASTPVLFDTPGNSVIRAPVRLDAAEVKACGAEWLQTVERGNVVFDLGGTNFADSTGVGALIRLRKRAREVGFHFCLAAPRPPVQAALRLMKLNEFFVIGDSVTAAQKLIMSTGRPPVAFGSVRENEVQLRWTGEVSAANSISLDARTEAELGGAAPGFVVVIDLAAVTFVDSTGIGLMLRLKKNLRRREVSLRFSDPTASVRNVLQHTRLTEYLLGEAP